jgi:aspartate aminotransferase-like enzyme
MKAALINLLSRYSLVLECRRGAAGCKIFRVGILGTEARAEKNRKYLRELATSKVKTYFRGSSDQRT